MNLLDKEMILNINPMRSTIGVEYKRNGVVSHKEVPKDKLLDCIRGSIRQEPVSSGLLPTNAISFSLDAYNRSYVSISHPERYADISYYNTLYSNFPLPRIVFGFYLHQGLRVQSCKMGVVAEERLTPETPMFHYPFSNVSGFSLCIGNNVLPKCESLHTLASLPYYILSAPNNDDYFRSEANKLNMGYRDLLEHLKDKDPSYYYSNVLIPNRKRLKDFLLGD